MAPSCAVKPAPTCAARATPATRGVISRVLANEEMTPTKAWAPICWSPVNPSSPTSVPVKKAMLVTTKNIPPPMTRAPVPIVMSDTSVVISRR